MTQPRLGQLLRWLSSDVVVARDGSVPSWVNPQHPGYPYPEAAGLLLSLASSDRDFCPAGLRQRVADWLLRQIGADGAVARGEVSYLFDAAIVLSGLLAHRAAGGSLGDADAPHRLVAFCRRQIEARRATPDAAADGGRWSLSFGAHQLKVALALCRYDDAFGTSVSARPIDILLDAALPLEAEGRFRIHGGSHDTFLHSTCYAAEGLAFLVARGRTELASALERTADWLASVQVPSGGLHAWSDGDRTWGELRADVAAQAVRLWCLVDRQRYQRPIAAALGFLADLQHRLGGLRFAPDSDDVNTWSSVFAVQAIRFEGHAPNALALV